MLVDYLYCELTFKPDGIHLSQKRLSATAFYSRLFDGFATINAAIGPQPKFPPGLQPVRGLEFRRDLVIDKDVPLVKPPPATRKTQSNRIIRRDAIATQAASLQFNPFADQNRIPVRPGRTTLFAFEAVAPPGEICGWLFTDPAFKLKDGVQGADRFTNMFTCCDRKVVRVTYTPKPEDAGSEYNYELRLEAKVWEQPSGQASGHVIIIVDPIIGNDEV